MLLETVYVFSLLLSLLSFGTSEVEWECKDGESPYQSGDSIFCTSSYDTLSNTISSLEDYNMMPSLDQPVSFEGIFKVTTDDCQTHESNGIRFGTFTKSFAPITHQSIHNEEYRVMAISYIENGQVKIRTDLYQNFNERIEESEIIVIDEEQYPDLRQNKFHADVNSSPNCESRIEIVAFMTNALPVFRN